MLLVFQQSIFLQCITPALYAWPCCRTEHNCDIVHTTRPLFALFDVHSPEQLHEQQPHVLPWFSDGFCGQVVTEVTLCVQWYYSRRGMWWQHQFLCNNRGNRSAESILNGRSQQYWAKDASMLHQHLSDRTASETPLPYAFLISPFGWKNKQHCECFAGETVCCYVHSQRIIMSPPLWQTTSSFRAKHCDWWSSADITRGWKNLPTLCSYFLKKVNKNYIVFIAYNVSFYDSAKKMDWTLIKAEAPKDNVPETENLFMVTLVKRFQYISSLWIACFLYCFGLIILLDR